LTGSKIVRPDLKRDPRRRHNSASRPLSSFNDQPFDAFNLLGIERRADTNQEISYGHLLVPSKSTKEKKHSHHDRCEHFEVTNTLSMRNHGFPRFFSHDPSLAGSARNSTTSPNPLFADKVDGDFEPMTGQIYSANLLDDPELVAGKHRTLLTFSSYITSGGFCTLLGVETRSSFVHF
jgi:hypothetical protein